MYAEQEGFLKKRISSSNTSFAVSNALGGYIALIFFYWFLFAQEFRSRVLSRSHCTRSFIGRPEFPRSDGNLIPMVRFRTSTWLEYTGMAKAKKGESKIGVERRGRK